MARDAAGATVRRVTLPARQWAALTECARLPVPPGFEPGDRERAVAEPALTELTARGLVVADGDTPGAVIPPLLAGLAALAVPSIGVRVDISATESGLRAVLAVAGAGAAGLVTLPDGAVEMSLFAPEELGGELARLVPDAATMRALAPAGQNIMDALNPGPQVPLSGVLPLAALTDYLPARALLDRAGLTGLARDLGLSAEDVALAEELAGQTVGLLHATVTGPLRDGVGVDQVVWFATNAGWMGLRPAPSPSDQALVQVVAAEPAELGRWLAPGISALLDAGPPPAGEKR